MRPSVENASLGEPTTKRVVTAVEGLIEALRAEYGEAFTIRVTGKGDILAASGGIFGEVTATNRTARKVAQKGRAT